MFESWPHDPLWSKDDQNSKRKLLFDNSANQTVVKQSVWKSMFSTIGFDKKIFTIIIEKYLQLFLTT